jgi:hypothetical protein
MAFIPIDGGVWINTDHIVSILPNKGGSSLVMVDGRVLTEDQLNPEELAKVIAQQQP